MIYRSARVTSTRLFLGMLLFCLFSVTLQAEPSYTGRTLEEALRTLQEKGLNILFSSDLVRPDMMVQREPVSRTPVQKLQELLSPYGLEWVSGPRDTLLVVQRQEKPKSSAERIVSQQPHMELSSYVVIPFVTVYLSAKDDDNNFVTKLSADQFLIKEDGTEQSIVDFMNLSQADKPHVEAPVTFFFLVDISQSTTLLLERISNFQLFRQAAVAVSKQLQPQDAAKLITFNHQVQTVQEMTHDNKILRAQLERTQNTGGKTAMLDALLKVLDDARHYSGRKIVVLFSDGCDNASKASADDVLAALKASDVTVFAFGSSSRDVSTMKGVKLLTKIADVTEGYAYFPKSVSEIDSSAAEMHQEIKNQYAAGYVPPDPDVRKWRQVEIKCKVPGVRLRYRKSYLF